MKEEMMHISKENRITISVPSILFKEGFVEYLKLHKTADGTEIKNNLLIKEYETLFNDFYVYQYDEDKNTFETIKKFV